MAQDKANSNFARGIAYCVAPEDVQDGYAPPGCMSDLMHGGINDSGTWQQSGPDPYFADFEGAGDQDQTMTGRGRSHPLTEVTYYRVEDTPRGARQTGPNEGNHPEPNKFRHEDWNEDYRQGPKMAQSPKATSFTGNKAVKVDRTKDGEPRQGGAAQRKKHP